MKRTPNASSNITLSVAPAIATTTAAAEFQVQLQAKTPSRLALFGLVALRLWSRIVGLRVVVVPPSIGALHGTYSEAITKSAIFSSHKPRAQRLVGKLLLKILHCGIPDQDRHKLQNKR